MGGHRCTAPLNNLTNTRPKESFRRSNGSPPLHVEQKASQNPANLLDCQFNHGKPRLTASIEISVNEDRTNKDQIYRMTL